MKSLSIRSNYWSAYKITALLIFSSLIFFNIACGVKGKPLPPLRPVQLSHGEPNFSDATEKLKIKKPNTKHKSEDDWNDEEDSEKSPEKNK